MLSDIAARQHQRGFEGEQQAREARRDQHQ